MKWHGITSRVGSKGTEVWAGVGVRCLWGDFSDNVLYCYDE